jgi:uncharacterized protein (DUF305 family)
MAILMSKRLLDKENSITPFLNKIITTQIKEIAYMSTFRKGGTK